MFTLTRSHRFISFLYSFLNKMSDKSKATDVRDMRKPYEAQISEEESKEPIGLFKKWFELACATPSIQEANAMALATASASGQPSCRYVLMKLFDERGFVFFTDKESRKGQEMTENPKASCLFYWDVLHRQVRIEGDLELLPESENIEYFQSRPRASQLAALASHQSQPISSRQELLMKHEQLGKKFGDGSIPKPERWGGVRVVPRRMEFWQGHTNRLHHRLVFRRLKEGEDVDPALTHKGQGGWVYEIHMP